MFRLAHISDLHIGPLPPVAARDLLGKRLLGYVSWRWRRHWLDRQQILTALRRDLQALAPDHIVITGDLVNIALPAEFEQTAAWLRALGPPERISVVPGNHDAFVRVAHDASLAHWSAYMTSDHPAPPTRSNGMVSFPYLRRRGPLAIIGLSTGIARPPGLATGRLGRAQLEALDRLLGELEGEDCCRVVLLHHPPLAGVSTWRRRLVDAPAFRRVVAQRGADLILHGHEHRLLSGALPGATGPIPVAGVPSASSPDPRPARRAQYRIYDIGETAGGWALGGRIRGYDAALRGFAPLPIVGEGPRDESAPSC